MAMSDVSGLTTEEFRWGNVCKGTAEALTAAGIVLAGQFPGQPGTGKVSATFYAGKLVARGGRPQKDEKYIGVKRISKGDFSATVYFSDAERALRNKSKKNAETLCGKKRAAV